MPAQNPAKLGYPAFFGTYGRKFWIRNFPEWIAFPKNFEALLFGLFDPARIRPNRAKWV